MALLAVSAAFGQEDLQETERDRLAQTGMKFLAVPLDARGVAIGDAMTALEGSAVSMFYNPSGMAHMEDFFQVSLGQVQWIADVNYNYGSLALRPAGGIYGTFGFTFLAADYGEFLGTIRDASDKGYQDTEIFSPTATALGMGYARNLTDRFAVGGHVKFIMQSLGASVMELDTLDNLVYADNEASTTAYDFGVFYRTGFRSLNFAMCVRNFSREITYYEENFELPLTLQIGLAMDLIDFTQLDKGTHSLLFSIATEHPRDYSEQIKMGGEYLFMKTLALRAGYVSPTDEQGISLGVGVQSNIGGFGFHLDYAYTDFGIFSAVNRLTMQLSF